MQFVLKQFFKGADNSINNSNNNNKKKPLFGYVSCFWQEVNSNTIWDLITVFIEEQWYPCSSVGC